MMQKVAKLALLKVVVLLMVVVVVLFGTNTLVSMQIAGIEDDLAKLNAQVLQVKSKLADIQAQQKIREEAKNFYTTYEISPSSEPTNFSRDKAKSNIASMRKQFGLNSIQLSNTGFKEIKSDFSTARSIALTSNATIRFSASYDMPIYDFIAAIDDSLPGVVSISNISIKRTGTYDAAALDNISKGIEINLVTGEVSFSWFGVVDPTRVPTQTGIAVDEHIDNLQNIFDKMSGIGSNLDKTILSSRPRPEAAQPQTPPAGAPGMQVAPQPLNNMQPAKQTPPSAAMPSPAPAPAPIQQTPPAAAKPAPATSNGVKKLQSLQPSNSVPAGSNPNMNGGANGQ